MKNDIIKTLMEKSTQELDTELKNKKSELFNLRFQLEVQQLENPHKIKDVKHDIARVMTVLREKNA
mgnify:CR=1 FL=1